MYLIFIILFGKAKKMKLGEQKIFDKKYEKYYYNFMWYIIIDFQTKRNDVLNSKQNTKFLPVYQIKFVARNF